MKKNRNKPLTDTEIKEIKRKHGEAMNWAIFWANDMGITLKEFFKLKKNKFRG